MYNNIKIRAIMGLFTLTVVWITTILLFLLSARYNHIDMFVCITTQQLALYVMNRLLHTP